MAVANKIIKIQKDMLETLGPYISEDGNLKDIELTDKFYKMYKGMYVNDTVYHLQHYTDCHTLDNTRLNLLDEDTYKEKHLGDGENGHIMARDKFINPYLDHRKGPRKAQANSPEWKRNR